MQVLQQQAGLARVAAAVFDQPHVAAERDVFAASLEGERADTFSKIKIEGIREATLGVVVGYDPTRGGSNVLGRHAIADTGNLLVGAMRNGEWLSLRSRPVNGHAVPLARIIGQEALLLGLEQGNERVYLHRSGDVALDLDGLDVRDWLTDGPAQRSTEAA